MNRLILSDLLAPLLGGDRIVVVDAGARDALSDPRWAALRCADIHGFDPDAAEVERLNAAAAEAGVAAKYYPYALWSASGRFTFYDNNAPGGGSFYEQNRALTDRWKFENIGGGLTPSRDLFYPVGTTDLDAVSLDDWAKATGVSRIDFLKMNIQGAELEVLCGANGFVSGMLGVLAEVSFVESYRNRPMFADIDQFLRRAGFEFFSLINHHEVGRLASPFTAMHAPGWRESWGQLIEGHALYLRDPINPDGAMIELEPASFIRQRIKLAMLAEAFGQIEYAFEVTATLGPTDERLAPIFDAAAAQYQSEYGVKIAA